MAPVADQNQPIQETPSKRVANQMENKLNVVSPVKKPSFGENVNGEQVRSDDNTEDNNDDGSSNENGNEDNGEEEVIDANDLDLSGFTAEQLRGKYFVGDVYCKEEDEPLLKENPRRFVLFPIQYTEVSCLIFLFLHSDIYIGLNRFGKLTRKLKLHSGQLKKWIYLRILAIGKIN